MSDQTITDEAKEKSSQFKIQELKSTTMGNSSIKLVVTIDTIIPQLVEILDANIIAKDREDNPILLVAVDYRKQHQQDDNLIIDFYQENGNIIPYIM